MILNSISDFVWSWFTGLQQCVTNAFDMQEIS